MIARLRVWPSAPTAAKATPGRNVSAGSATARTASSGRPAAAATSATPWLSVSSAAAKVAWNARRLAPAEVSTSSLPAIRATRRLRPLPARRRSSAARQASSVGTAVAIGQDHAVGDHQVARPQHRCQAGREAEADQRRDPLLAQLLGAAARPQRAAAADPGERRAAAPPRRHRASACRPITMPIRPRPAGAPAAALTPAR